jgi:hypothetical protein
MMIGSKYDAMKEHYIEYRVLRYLLENPSAKPSKARKYARVAWKRKVDQWRKNKVL